MIYFNFKMVKIVKNRWPIPMSRFSPRFRTVVQVYQGYQAFQWLPGLSFCIVTKHNRLRLHRYTV